MQAKGVFTKTLAFLGTVLVWFPIVAPLLLSAVAIGTERMFRFDWLMPAELFPAALVGGLLLLWAAVRDRCGVQLVAWGLTIAAVSLIGGQALAVLTGLASGETEPTGWRWAVVVGSIAVYSLAVIALGIGGITLLCDLFRRPQSPTATAEP
jgi:hypothetical protein